MEGLSTTNKVVVNDHAHLETLLICEMKHPGWVVFAPMFKSVHFDALVMHGAIEVHRLPSVVPDAILVKPMVLCDAIVQVQGEDGLVKPFHLVNHVAFVAAGQWAIVSKPSQLWGVHDVANSDSVRLLRVDGHSILNGGSEPVKPVHELLLGAASDQVVVARHNDDIKCSGVGLVNIV